MSGTIALSEIKEKKFMLFDKYLLTSTSCYYLPNNKAIYAFGKYCSTPVCQICFRYGCFVRITRNVNLTNSFIIVSFKNVIYI